MSNGDTCYICCEPGAKTRDHVVPDGFFPAPKPTNLLTLPAHKSCHNRLDEEYVRNLLASIGRDTSTAAASLWDRTLNAAGKPSGIVARSFLRNAPLRHDFMRRMVPRAPVFSEGVYLGDSPAIDFDRERVYPSLQKVVRGLYRHHTGRLLPRDAEFSWRLNEILTGPREDMFACATPGLALGDVFDSRYIVDQHEGLEVVAWWLRFYNWTVFRCFVTPRAAA